MIPYRVYSHYSIQRSALHIDDLIEKAFQLKLPAISLTDYNSISGIPEFLQLIEKKNKNSEIKIKPIVGVTIRYLSEECEKNIDRREIVLLCKNKQGWKELIKLISTLNCKSEKYLNFGDLYDSDNLICIDSVKDTELSDMFENRYYTYSDLGDLPPVYYANSDDKIYQQIVICSEQKIKIDDVKQFLETEDGIKFKHFFDNTDYSLRHIDNTLSDILLNQVESFSIADKPQIPNYIDENGNKITNPNEYLTNLCREGWKQRNINGITANNTELRQIYTNRIKEELSTINDAGMSNYFLIVKDIVQKCRNDEQSVGLRGSAVGCLTLYLMGITNIDPVCPDPGLSYDPTKSLVFARFLNKGRLQKDVNALADIDIDLVPSYRDTLKTWLKNKYGEPRCSNIATFQKFKGAGAVKEVFRVFGHSFDLANEITSKMVSEASVQDEIEDAKEDNPKYNLINYCVDNIPEINNWYQEFKREFDLAIHLSNTIRAEGQHAAGIIMANDNIDTFIPIGIDEETGEKIAKFKMQDVEYVGGVKFDLLNVSALEKIDNIVRMINKKG